MVKIYEGKNEQDAIEKAMAELGLEVDEFEVEIMESEEKKGFFSKKVVKIKVHYNDNGKNSSTTTSASSHSSVSVARVNNRNLLDSSSEIETKIISFLQKTIEFMGYKSEIEVLEREKGRFVLNIKSDEVSILIGKQGKNLEALQTLANAYLTSFLKDDESLKVTVDAENYRFRREDMIVRMAVKSANIVAKSKTSQLLEPMNPFERRLIHTALNNRDDVITQSEGDGLYKQVRIMYKGSR